VALFFFCVLLAKSCTLGTKSRAHPLVAPFRCSPWLRKVRHKSVVQFIRGLHQAPQPLHRHWYGSQGAGPSLPPHFGLLSALFLFPLAEVGGVSQPGSCTLIVRFLLPSPCAVAQSSCLGECVCYLHKHKGSMKPPMLVRVAWTWPRTDFCTRTTSSTGTSRPPTCSWTRTR